MIRKKGTIYKCATAWSNDSILSTKLNDVSDFSTEIGTKLQSSITDYNLETVIAKNRDNMQQNMHEIFQRFEGKKKHRISRETGKALWIC